MEQPRGLARLVALGVEKLEATAQAPDACYMGVELAQFTTAMRAFAAAEPKSADGRPVLELR